MTDPQSPHDDAVRRLLADARHEQPMPDDVAARLDAVLADLRTEDVAPPVVDLAAARRRRTRLRNGLVAAAAVVLVGFGVSQVDLSGMSAGESDAGGAADSSVAREDAAAAPSATAALPSVVRLSSARLEQQVRRLVGTTDPLLLADPAGQAGTTSSAPECPVPTAGGVPLTATYDGEPAVLVLQPPAGGVRVADVYLCGAESPVRSVSVPAG